MANLCAGCGRDHPAMYVRCAACGGPLGAGTASPQFSVGHNYGEVDPGELPWVSDEPDEAPGPVHEPSVDAGAAKPVASSPARPRSSALPGTFAAEFRDKQPPAVTPGRPQPTVSGAHAKSQQTSGSGWIGGVLLAFALVLAHGGWSTVSHWADEASSSGTPTPPVTTPLYPALHDLPDLPDLSLDDPAPSTTSATARCRDGSLSYSQHHSGTCSWHGGVSSWLDGSSTPSSASIPAATYGSENFGSSCFGTSIRTCSSYGSAGTTTTTCYSSLGSCDTRFPDGSTSNTSCIGSYCTTRTSP